MLDDFALRNPCRIGVGACERDCFHGIPFSELGSGFIRYLSCVSNALHVHERVVRRKVEDTGTCSYFVAPQEAGDTRNRMGWTRRSLTAFDS